MLSLRCALKITKCAQPYETSRSLLPVLHDQPSHSAATSAHLHKIHAAGQPGDIQYHFFGALLPDRDLYASAGKIMDTDLIPGYSFSFHGKASRNRIGIYVECTIGKIVNAQNHGTHRDGEGCAGTHRRGAVVGHRDGKHSRHAAVSFARRPGEGAAGGEGGTVGFAGEGVAQHLPGIHIGSGDVESAFGAFGEGNRRDGAQHRCLVHIGHGDGYGPARRRAEVAHGGHGERVVVGIGGGDDHATRHLKVRCGHEGQGAGIRDAESCGIGAAQRQGHGAGAGGGEEIGTADGGGVFIHFNGRGESSRVGEGRGRIHRNNHLIRRRLRLAGGRIVIKRGDAEGQRHGAGQPQV